MFEDELDDETYEEGDIVDFFCDEETFFFLRQVESNEGKEESNATHNNPGDSGIVDFRVLH